MSKARKDLERDELTRNMQKDDKKSRKDAKDNSLYDGLDTRRRGYGFVYLFCLLSQARTQIFRKGV